MLEACASGDGFERKENCGMNMDEIIDECKTFFFRGAQDDVTSSDLDCVPAVHKPRMAGEAPGGGPKTVWSLCPTYKEKQAKGMELGGIKIPKDTMLAIPIMMIHRDKELWGPDANEFDPSRFVNSIAKAAKHPSALLPFSIGPRSCIGKNFAMLEAKTVLAVLLQ
ncbi:Cytochrome P450 734A6, partial [Ananas comosus]